ncbi:protein asteroid homolog 1-like isoform X1 [Bombus huntii]|uniref:protein asteroid homolog 1-like isoform X1 n=1 Tax=Bombus huntii TaxID=85661 RepID=UPI0021A97D9D|nr:protein asteroid homolog 1-like isoform X1 [Bombus huntii]
MGIPGLTTYINNRSDRYLEYYELHNTYLVIDGNSVCCSIYNLYAKCNCAFGGDYDNYAQCVSDFFNDLLRCKVTPLVLFDGGSENKKFRTVIKRTKQKIRAAWSFSPLNQRNMKFFPLMLREVFIDVMREKNIRHVQCLFEADNDIASVARILNCPVLSYDSDFYIYGTLYIPFDTLDTYVVKNPNGNGYMKCCKIYKVENLLKSFKGLDQSMLPLAAILLGNDYVKRNTFKNFFRHLKLRGASRKKHNHRQCCIETTLRWLSNYTLDKAIIEVLSRLIKPIRQKILDLIEININSYTNASAEMLLPLGFSKDYVVHVNTYHLNRSFKFDGDISSLTYIEEVYKEGNNESSEEENEDDEIEMANICSKTELVPQNVVSKLPMWFVNEFLMGKYPKYFMDLIVRYIYVCPVQVEDYRYPSSIIVSLKIISVIFGILKSAIISRICYMKYMVRTQNKKIICCKLQSTETMNNFSLPSLFNLRDIPSLTQREILNNTLGITDMDCINELPPEWMLYIGCIKYWIHQEECSLSHECYLYSIFICMLFNIVDSKIGRYRSMHTFQKRYCQLIETVKQQRKKNNCDSCYTMNQLCGNQYNGTIIEAYNEIDYNDCVLAAPFFISYFNMNKELYKNPKKFDRFTVHVFAEFQSCLRHAMNLNALLGYPYPQTKVANLFNGTLLYNLSNNFKTRYDIEEYINIVLQMSPSLLRLFNTFLLKVKSMFPFKFQDGTNLRKKHRTKPKHPKTKKSISSISDSEYFSADDDLNEACYDPNNRFSMLNHI